MARPRSMRGRLTDVEVAAILGISRRTVHRWVKRGRIPPPSLWFRARIQPLAKKLAPLRKGPKRNPESVRYTTGRHSFYEIRNARRFSIGT